MWAVQSIVLFVCLRFVGAQCPLGWYGHGQRCFHANCTLLSRDSAQAVCQSNGGFLATVNTSEIQGIVRDLVQPSSHGSAGALPLWIGLRELQPGNNFWQWEDTASYPLTGAFWDNGTNPVQPDNHDGIENCVVMGYRNCGPTFHDVSCGHIYPFVCELNKTRSDWRTRQWGADCGSVQCDPIPNNEQRYGDRNCSDVFEPIAPASTPIVAPPTPLGASCPRGWYSHNGSCVRGVCTLLDWVGAQANCACHGGFLVTANSSERNNVSRSLVQIATTSLPGNIPVWIGLRELTQDAWSWVENNQSATDFFWADGEPNNLQADSQRENCAYMGFRNCTSLWFDGHCQRNRILHVYPSVCQLDKRLSGWHLRHWGSGSGVALCDRIDSGHGGSGGGSCGSPVPLPTSAPSPLPTVTPTRVPTGEPTDLPTVSPTNVPTNGTQAPTFNPTNLSSIEQPTAMPTGSPVFPTSAPTDASGAPVPASMSPTLNPTPGLRASLPTPPPTRVPSLLTSDSSDSGGGGGSVLGIIILAVTVVITVGVLSILYIKRRRQISNDRRADHGPVVTNTAFGMIANPIATSNAQQSDVEYRNAFDDVAKDIVTDTGEPSVYQALGERRASPGGPETYAHLGVDQATSYAVPTPCDNASAPISTTATTDASEYAVPEPVKVAYVNGENTERPMYSVPMLAQPDQGSTPSTITSPRYVNVVDGVQQVENPELLSDGVSAQPQSPDYVNLRTSIGPEKAPPVDYTVPSLVGSTNERSVYAIPEKGHGRRPPQKIQLDSGATLSMSAASAGQIATYDQPLPSDTVYAQPNPLVPHNASSEEVYDMPLGSSDS